MSISLSISFVGCWDDDVEPEISGGKTFFPGARVIEYDGYAPLAERPIKVHYSIPNHGDISQMPILFVFPGLERNADDYLNSWKGASDSRNFMVFVLEFSKDLYTTSQYIEGGMFENGQPVEPEKWTFSLIEPLFDLIREETGSQLTQYDLWGHSAGAQFVHRYATFMPNARIHRAVSANAGWYTLPDADVEYPYGLKHSGGADAATLKQLFATELIIQLGTADTSRDGLNTTAGAEAQGQNRFERGNYYFNKSKQIASEGAYNFKWKRVEVEGVAHDQTQMASAAVQLLY